MPGWDPGSGLELWHGSSDEDAEAGAEHRLSLALFA